MGSLKNQRHEAFALNVAKQFSDVEAYRKAFKCSKANAIKNAWTLRENKGITARISELQKKAESATVMTMRDRREWMSRVKNVNLYTFDPEKDGDLADEIVINSDGSKRIKLASKRACIMDDAKLAGELIEKTDLVTDGQALPAAMPQIIIATPTSFATRRSGSQSN